MTRVKRGPAANKRRKNLLKRAKGFRGARKSKYRAAKQALFKAWTYAYRDRRTKKREFRKLWNIRINAACKQQGTNYSRFIKGLKDNKIELDRKILADLAMNESAVFTEIVKAVKPADK